VAASKRCGTFCAPDSTSHVTAPRVLTAGHLKVTTNPIAVVWISVPYGSLC
jgi:hypothetical protein